MAAIYEGATRTQAAVMGGVTLQIVRDWVVKFNAQGPGGLIDRKPPGQPSRLNDTHRAALAAILESGPIPAVHGVVRWRVVDLCQWIFEEFGVSIAEPTLSRDPRFSAGDPTLAIRDSGIQSAVLASAAKKTATHRLHT